jgi:ascorbate-specific PTS system EIIC-type component UlaA
MSLQKKSSLLGTIGAIWGLAGVLLLLASAALRLGSMALDAFSYHFLWHHWTSLAVIVLGMAYVEGYKGFQKAFSPRTAARARYLRQNPRIVHVALAPFFCMGYFFATRRRQITSIALTSGIIVLIILIRFVAQPWRGIIDAGVVVGLTWGIVSLLVYSVQALLQDDYFCSPEVPDKE